MHAQSLSLSTPALLWAYFIEVHPENTLGDTMNALMAAAAFNFKKWMRVIEAYFRFAIFRLRVLLWSLNNTAPYNKIRKIGTF